MSISSDERFDAPRHGMDHAAEERLLSEQITAIARNSKLFGFLSVTSIALMALTFWREGPRGALAGVAGVLVVLHGAAIWQSRRWLTDARRTPPRFARGVRITFAGLIGALWGGMLMILSLNATLMQQQLLSATSVGLISSGMGLASLLPAALAYEGVLIVSCLVSVVLSHEYYEAQHALLMVLLSILNLVLIARQNQEFTRRVRNELELEEQGRLVGLLLSDFEESASDWLWEADAGLTLRRVSAHMARAVGVAAEDLVGCSLAGLFAEGEEAREGLAMLAAATGERRPFRDVALPVRAGERLQWWSLTGKPVVDGQGRFYGYRGVATDVTVSRQAEERILRLARFDSLTELPNRAQFNEALARLVEEGPDVGFAVMFLDLDGFKNVNDTLGHAVGDALLVAAAGRLRGCVREGDMMARLGGDEFAVIQHGADMETAAMLANRLIARVGEPFQIGGVPVTVGVSVGVALGQGGGPSPHDLLRQADLALYAAKDGGRGVWRFFEPEMSEKADAKHLLLADLRQALAREELVLHFQPILCFEGGVVAAEALLRWRHPERGMIPPNDFIPLAEESGLIVPIGAWVLRQACREAASWSRPIRVAVNLSPLQFGDPAFLSIVEAALYDADLPPERLELEITESLFVEASEHNLELLHRLRARGIHIALDDFGTGYSALGYLRSFPFDRVKIDRSFVRELGENSESTAIIRAITDMATSLGMHTTAEGVETQRQAELLRHNGCGQVQGFLYSRPCPPPEAARFIASNGVAVMGAGR